MPYYSNENQYPENKVHNVEEKGHRVSLLFYRQINTLEKGKQPMVEMNVRFSSLKGHCNTQTLSMKFVPQSTCLFTNYILGRLQAK